MPTTFLVSDTHFGHKGVCHFLNADGSKLRPWDNPDDMDRDMVASWNSVVRPNDKVYHLGDVVINRRALSILDELNGDKVLIKCNHDIFKLHEYTRYFRDVRAYHVMNNFILSHIPVHPDSKGRFAGNIHGHLHSRRLDDAWYHCVCVEQTDFRPISFEVVMNKINNNASLAQW